MNAPARHEEDDDQGDVFLDEDDVLQEINVDEEGESISPFSFSLYLCGFFFVCVCACSYF